MKKAYCCLFLAFAAQADSSSTVLGGEPIGQPDSAGHYITLPETQLAFDAEMVEPARYNPLVSGVLSAALPGLGQVYCSTGESPARKRGRIIKGGLFFVANGIAAGVTANRVSFYRAMDQILHDTTAAREAYAGMQGTAPDSASRAVYRTQLEYTALSCELARFDRRAARYAMYQSIGWSSGMYLFNVLDAVGSSRFAYSDSRRNPFLAAWLSAIPALGLGQLYNGSPTKAGMIWMVQTMLLNMAYNNQRLMTDCIKQQDMFADSTAWHYGYRTDTKLDPVARWDEKYDEAFRKRNLYLWYAIFFYFYGVFDAVVDAHLHDYRRRIRMEPAFEVHSEGVGLSVRLDF